MPRHVDTKVEGQVVAVKGMTEEQSVKQILEFLHNLSNAKSTMSSEKPSATDRLLTLVF